MSLSKENLLEEFDEYIDNEYYCMVDYDLSETPHLEKERVLKQMNERINRLRQFKNQLKDVLNEG